MSKKFKRDVSWNMISFVIIGVSGIVLNILIGSFYGAGYLGVFNQIFAVYILLSQVAVFGIHLSTLKYISEIHNNHKEVTNIIFSSLVLVSGIACVTTIISLFMSNILGTIFDSSLVEVSWKYIAIGLFFFALNKVLLSIVNGFRDMIFFAISQALRYVLALIIIFIFIGYKIDGNMLGLVISISEMILFLFLAKRVYNYIDLKDFAINNKWYKVHLDFGKKSFIGGVMLELNTRVDVLVLGLFVSDRMVGIYTIALMIFEGFVQLSVVMRNNYNPLIAKLVKESKLVELKDMVVRGRNKFYIAMFVLILISFPLYSIFINIFLDEIFLSSVNIYYILMIGVILSSGYLPFDMLLTQAGHPHMQTLFKTFVVLGNVVLNFIFIPIWGIYGAAIATTSIYVLSVFLLKFLVAKKIGIKI